MIGGEPYTLGLFDTAGENFMSFIMFWSVTMIVVAGRLSSLGNFAKLVF